MADEIPQWAKERANALATAERGDRMASGIDYMNALARYVASVEEEPVDPLYEALRAVVELGRYDTREQTELLRRELIERGLQIVELAKDGS